MKITTGVLPNASQNVTEERCTSRVRLQACKPNAPPILAAISEARRSGAKQQHTFSCQGAAQPSARTRLGVCRQTRAAPSQAGQSMAPAQGCPLCRLGTGLQRTNAPSVCKQTKGQIDNQPVLFRLGAAPASVKAGRQHPNPSPIDGEH